MDDDDRRRLVEFVFETRADLDWVLPLYADVEGSEGRSSEITSMAFQIWDDMREVEIARLEEALMSFEHDERLDGAGLGGLQLTFKLAVIEAARADAHRAAEQTDSTQQSAGDPQDAPRWGRRVRAFLGKLLDAIDIVLDSLVGALMGVGEALKEFKDALRVRLS